MHVLNLLTLRKAEKVKETFEYHAIFLILVDREVESEMTDAAIFAELSCSSSCASIERAKSTVLCDV